MTTKHRGALVSDLSWMAQSDSAEAAVSMQFRNLYKQIDEELSKAEVESLKFLCTDMIPRAELEAASRGIDLISQLENRKRIGHGDTAFLAELLLRLGRLDLVRRLGYNPQQFRAQIQTFGSHLPAYRCFLFDVSEDLEAREVDTLTFLAASHLSRQQVAGVKDARRLFLMLERVEVLVPTDVSILVQLAESIHRQDLLDRIQSYRAGSSHPRVSNGPLPPKGPFPPAAVPPGGHTAPPGGHTGGYTAPHGGYRPLPTKTPLPSGPASGLRMQPAPGEKVDLTNIHESTSVPLHAMPHMVNEMPPGGYTAPPGGYTAPPGGYSAPPGGFSAPPGGYSAPPGGYTSPPGSYTSSPGGYSAPPGGKSGNHYDHNLPSSGRIINDLSPNDNHSAPSVGINPSTGGTSVPMIGHISNSVSGGFPAEPPPPYSLHNPHPLSSRASAGGHNPHPLSSQARAGGHIESGLPAVSSGIHGITPVGRMVSGVPGISPGYHGTSSVQQPGTSQVNGHTQPMSVPQPGSALQSARVMEPVPPHQPSAQRHNPAAHDDSPRYKMTARPRGKCIILNNTEFYKETEKSKRLNKREGTEVDVGNLKYIFEKLEFEVHEYHDLKSTEMVQLMMQYAINVDHTNYDCFAVCILSHGIAGKLYGVNGELVNILDLTNPFKGVSCPTLNGKPKLFFIQACQGKEKQQGVEIEEDSPGEGPVETIPNEADFLLGYSTLPGFVSYRSKSHGSWYITKVVEMLDKYAHRDDLLSIMIRVNEEVSKATALIEGSEYKQSPAPVPTLRKKVYFSS